MRSSRECSVRLTSETFLSRFPEAFLSLAAASHFVCSLQTGCDWSRVLGFGLGLIVGLGNALLFELTFAWTAYLLKKAVGRATLWGATLASIVAIVVSGASLLLPILPFGLFSDRKAYIASAMWGVLVGSLIQTARERWRS